MQVFRQQPRRNAMQLTIGRTMSVAALILLVLVLPMAWPNGAHVSLIAQDEGGAAAKTEADTPCESAEKGEAALEKLVDLDMVDVPLDEALNAIAEKVDLQTLLKLQWLENLGISGDVPVSASLKQIPAHFGLDMILEPLGLSYVVRHDVIVVTSLEDSACLGDVRVYDCRDLLRKSPQMGGGMGGGMGMMGMGGMGMGGMGGGGLGGGGLGGGPNSGAGQQDDRPAGKNDDSNTRRKRSRKKRGEKAKSGQPSNDDQSRAVSLPNDVLAQFGGGGCGFGDGGGGFGFGGGGGGFGGGQGMGFGGGQGGGFGMGMGMESGNPPTSSFGDDALIDLIKTTVDVNGWDNMGGPWTISRFDGSLVIRTTPQVHRKIDRLIESLRETKANSAFGGGQMHGGGFF